uniref:Minor capsid component n=1 Tax=Myoviridae sp. ctt8G1 TaxID=2827713 RepID=A0A8S5TFY0_9CAUD|nr:MAG TPA: minor capsid component [Myoviridae sp. ctt8G1]
MMRTLYSLKGSEFRIGILAKPKVQEFVEAHAGVLDSGFSRVEMSETMRRRLTRSDYVFSGIKTFHELREAFPSLLDGNGKRKPFEQFLNDVRKIDETYNSNYLRAEYNFVQASAEMAARWEQFAEDGDRYNLQYRTAADGKVRPAHAALHGVTLPITDPFWEEYYPPNGWNCRCTVVQVRKSKYPETPHDEAMALGEEALQKDSKGMFRFNAGKERKTVPDYNPYTIRRCRDCDVAKGKLKLAFVPDNELCQACRIIRQCAGNREKTQRAVERTHYLHEMEPLLKKSVAKTAGDKNLNVGFTKYGNKHLFSDTFGRSSILRKDDLASLDEVLKGAEFIDGSALTHPRTDDIVHFYYFKAQIRGLWVRLNVAKQVYRRPSGQVEIRYFMYSINDI